MTRRFLVAVDFSTLTEATVAAAVRLAHGTDTALDLAYVTPPAAAAPVLGHPAAQDLLDQLAHREAKAAEAKLTHLLTELVPEPLRGEVVVLKGLPADRICEAAKEGYELVVLATNGRRGVQHLLLGSVAERVVRMCPVPVLVVR